MRAPFLPAPRAAGSEAFPASVLTRQPASPAPVVSFPSALFHYYKQPLMIVEGKMQYLFDETGRRYVDVRSSSL